MKKIELIARFSIHEGEIEKFKSISSECIGIVKEKEPETLQYEWYFNEDNSECTVIEQYKNPEALLTHMGNLGPQIGKLMEISDLKGEVYGEAPEEFTNAMQGLDIKTYSYFDGK